MSQDQPCTREVVKALKKLPVSNPAVYTEVSAIILNAVSNKNRYKAESKRRREYSLWETSFKEAERLERERLDTLERERLAELQKAEETLDRREAALDQREAQIARLEMAQDIKIHAVSCKVKKMESQLAQLRDKNRVGEEKLAAILLRADEARKLKSALILELNSQISCKVRELMFLQERIDQALVKIPIPVVS
jgi:hypothetical protein